MITLNGFTFAPGVGRGQAVVLTSRESPNEDQDSHVDRDLLIERFQRRSRGFTQRLQQIMRGSTPDGTRDLMGAAAGFLSDPDNNHAIIERISHGTPVRQSCREVLMSALAGLGGSGLEQGEQLRGLIEEFIRSLGERNEIIHPLPELKDPAVVVARDLTPAAFMCLNTDAISAVVLEGGHSSGHLGVLLRELQIPTVFGIAGATSIDDGTLLLVDANNGAVMVGPPQEILDKYERNQAISGDELDEEPPRGITVACSMGTMRELQSGNALRHGLGLLRSEFLFLGCEQEPSCEEMQQVFSRLFAKIPAHAPITARTFDFAGDKRPRFETCADDQGPLAGYGAAVSTRLLQKELRALLCALPERRITIVFPLITRHSECRCIRDLLDGEIQALKGQGIPHSECDFALMVETPAAVLTAPAFASLSSMFIIGTSSLAEYAAAPRPADNAFTPALAKMIAIACRAACNARVQVGIAGRFATRLELLPLFMRLGVTYISVDGPMVPRIITALQRSPTEVHSSFNPGLYQRVMEIDTGAELSELINSLSISE
ncbi:MAG: hypothetical protein K6A65_01065 [Succinivibrionaceae bacterium]|nr:hypothetical protein [Succinivibrionaceae bacterium]